MLTAKGTKLTKLAGEKKKRLPDEEKASRTVTINLDLLSHEAIISRVAEVMRDVGSLEREIACFKEDAINARNYETVIATAIGWKAPVRFIRNGKPWFRSDWRRLTPWQPVKRRVSLWGGSYVHPDGDIELDIDEKAGVNPGDSQVVADAKINAYLQRQGIKELKWQWFFLDSFALPCLSGFLDQKYLTGRKTLSLLVF
jgi:hypothetical protein